MNSTEEPGRQMTPLYFGWLDFSAFGLMLGFSALIGIYFGCFGKKQESRVDYLFGGKALKTLPVAVSLVASHFSGITLMGVPSEVFYHGALYWMVNVSSVIVTVIILYIYLPLFYQLQLRSTYEYLQLRFSRSVRTMASVLFTISVLLYIPLVIYVPALAFSYVSGLSIHFITPLVCIICIFYTMLGGLKAVVWIDFLQSCIIVVSCITIIILGLIHVGGIGVVWERSMEGGRINLFEMDPNPLVRATFWNVIIGNIFSWLTYCAVNQGMVQKFLALPSFAKAKESLMMFTVGIFIIKSISCFTGLIIYATYSDCDPVKSKAIRRQDQIVPFYIMDIAATIPGLPGLFIAGVFSAALSSMASNLNSLACTMYEDFIEPCLRRKISEKTASYVIRFVVVVIGAISVCMVFVVERLGGILQLAYTTTGVTSGAFLGLFSLGIFFPKANSKVTNDDAFVLFRISFMYYTLIGTFILISVGMIVSYITGVTEPEEMNPDLYAPFLRKNVMELKKKCSEKKLAERELLNTPNDRKISEAEED